jgi:hypothetical protein
VLTELRVLASPEAEVATVFSDTDIFSSRENMVDLATSDTWPHAGEQNSISAAFSSLDTDIELSGTSAQLKRGVLHLLSRLTTSNWSFYRSIGIFASFLYKRYWT